MKVTIKDTYAGGNTQLIGTKIQPLAGERRKQLDPILRFIRSTTAAGVVAKQPPFCLNKGEDVTSNRVGSCLYECPVGYEKHKFIECSDEDIKELCCCGKCI